MDLIDIKTPQSYYTGTGSVENVYFAVAGKPNPNDSHWIKLRAVTERKKHVNYFDTLCKYPNGKVYNWMDEETRARPYPKFNDNGCQICFFLYFPDFGRIFVSSLCRMLEALE